MPLRFQNRDRCRREINAPVIRGNGEGENVVIADYPTRRQIRTRKREYDSLDVFNFRVVVHIDGKGYGVFTVRNGEGSLVGCNVILAIESNVIGAQNDGEGCVRGCAGFQREDKGFAFFGASGVNRTCKADIARVLDGERVLVHACGNAAPSIGEITARRERKDNRFFIISGVGKDINGNGAALSVARRDVN